nr:hypothetical protein BaRGS_002279 [Batillaria attramentaria]
MPALVHGLHDKEDGILGAYWGIPPTPTFRAPQFPPRAHGGPPPSKTQGCNDTFSDQINGKVVAVARGNCTFVEKAAIVQKHGGVAVLVVDFNDGHDMTSPGVGNDTDYDLINITVAIMHHSDFTALMGGGSEVRVRMYSPVESKFDPAVLVMFSLATVCVVTGGLWSGTAQATSKKPRGRKSGGGKETDDEDEEQKEEDNMSLGMGIAMSIGLIVFFCVTLTLLYFFYDYLGLSLS